MDTTPTRRYFLSYSGVKLPLQLVGELEEGALLNRNTWFVAEYDGGGRLRHIEKRVYGEIEMTHDYDYASDGRLTRATIQVGDDEPQIVELA